MSDRDNPPCLCEVPLDYGYEECPAHPDDVDPEREAQLRRELELLEGRIAQEAAEEAIRREVDGDGGYGEILAETLGVDPDGLEEWNASGVEDPQRVPRPLEELARATPATELPPDLAAAVRLSEAMRDATRHDHDPAVETSCPDAIAAQRDELAARRRLDDLAVHVLEAFLVALDTDDRDDLLGILEHLATRARFARWDESRRDDPDAQRTTSLESTVRIAHREAVAIVDDLIALLDNALAAAQDVTVERRGR